MGSPILPQRSDTVRTALLLRLGFRHRRVGAFGHSFGDAVAVQFCHRGTWRGARRIRSIDLLATHAIAPPKERP